MRRIALVALFCFAAAPLQAQDKDTFQKLTEKFSQTFNQGDFAAMGQLYTQGATLMPPEADFIRGRDDIQKFWQAASEQIQDLKTTTVDVKSLGDNAVREVGTFTLKTKGQQQQEVVGKYVAVWQMDGGEWRIETDIWNSNK